MNLRQLCGCGAPAAGARLVWPLLLGLLFALSACGQGPATPSPALSAAIAVETGSMALPGSAAGGAAAVSSPMSEEPPASTATVAPVLAAGEALVLPAAAAVYAAPDRTALRFGEYGAGSRLLVLEPDGDYTVYPVDVSGQRWYRVRTEDGLAGWVMAP